MAAAGPRWPGGSTRPTRPGWPPTSTRCCRPRQRPAATGRLPAACRAARRLPLLGTGGRDGLRPRAGTWSPARAVLLGPAHFVPLTGVRGAAHGRVVDAARSRTGGCGCAGTSHAVPGVHAADEPHAARALAGGAAAVPATLARPALPVLPVVTAAAPEDVADLLDAVAGPDTLVIASTDLSHHLPDVEARRRDGARSTPYWRSTRAASNRVGLRCSRPARPAGLGRPNRSCPHAAVLPHLRRRDRRPEPRVGYASLALA